ncbi:DNA alkylation repair protein [Candidatus Dojkabacteria bacterium]|nr:DNA alkylation repair protein [Candidatus Dojkabacteria bacterium]
MEYSEVIQLLKSKYNSKNVKGLTKAGINPQNALGIRIPELRKLAKEIGKNHKLALKLWDSKIHEARILASMIDDPEQVSERQMEVWTKDFNSWDLCDQVCMNLYKYTDFAWDKAKEWTERKEEFVKRAGFALMATLAVGNKDIKNNKYLQYTKVIKQGSTDDRNFVKKAVNWAIRQIGKRNIGLNKEMIKLAKEIQTLDSKAAKWIAKDAIKELQSKKIQARLKKKK